MFPSKMIWPHMDPSARMLWRRQTKTALWPILALEYNVMWQKGSKGLMWNSVHFRCNTQLCHALCASHFGGLVPQPMLLGQSLQCTCGSNTTLFMIYNRKKNKSVEKLKTLNGCGQKVLKCVQCYPLFHCTAELNSCTRVCFSDAAWNAFIYPQSSCRSKEALLGLRSEPSLSLDSVASSSICHDGFCQARLTTGKASSSNSQLCSLASFHSSSLFLLPENTRTMEISQSSKAFQVFSKKHETSASIPCWRHAKPAHPPPHTLKHLRTVSASHHWRGSCPQI